MGRALADRTSVHLPYPEPAQSRNERSRVEFRSIDTKTQINSSKLKEAFLAIVQGVSSDGAAIMIQRLILIGILLAFNVTPVCGQKKENERLASAGRVMSEILRVPDNIPSDLLQKAECVIVLPSVLKFAIGIGGSYGRGVMVCRSGDDFSGPWGAPSMIALEGGSFGLQLGGQATDFVLLVMNRRGAQGILSSKVQLGADASAAAGPKGRDASAATDATMRAEILTYSRSRGLFAGVSLEGSTLRPDNGANKKLYKKELHARDIVLHKAIGAPASAKQLLSVLNSKSPRNRSQRG
jgi:lipid-binding SYLF domain-containing protein